MVQGRYVYWSFFFSDHCIKQILDSFFFLDSFLPGVCSVTESTARRQNVLKTSVTHLPVPDVELLCFYHILMSSVIYYWGPLRGGAHVPRLNFTASYVAISEHSRVARRNFNNNFLARYQSDNLHLLQRRQRNIRPLSLVLLSPGF